MTSITCETATLTDAVARAARIAPSKGAAFDKSAGILLDVRPNKDKLYIKASDLEVTYLQRVATMKMEGRGVEWRVQSKLFADIVASLPLGSGATTTLRDEDGELFVESGSTKAKLRVLDPDRFPKITPFDPDGMTEVDDLPRRLDQVAWAADPKATVLSGVHVTGTGLAGCDRYVLALVPCAVPVAEPITVPLGTITGLLKNLGSVKVRATAQRLEIMPDDDTQITCALLLEPYPAVEELIRDDYTVKIKAGRQELMECIERLTIMARGERHSIIEVTVEADRLHMSLEVDGQGRMDDSVGVTVDGPTPFLFSIGPRNLKNALGSSARPDIVIRVGPDSTKLIEVADDNDYKCLVAPIADQREPEEGEE